MTPPSLLDPPPALRRLRADEAPYPGTLRAGDPPTVWVEIDDLPEEIWRAQPDGHLLVPHDIARTAAGHVAILPHCVERLTHRLDERTLAAGEMVTVAVSLVRGAAQAQSLAIDAGRWWVDAEGRPVLAAGGQGHWLDDTLALLERMGSSSSGRLRQAIDATSAALCAKAFTPRDAEECEDALFDAAEPAPLALRTPLRGPGTLSVAAVAPAPLRVATLRRDASEPQEPATSWLARFTGDDVAERVGAGIRTLTAVPARLATIRERRRAVSQERRARTTTDAVSTAPARPTRRRAPLLVAAAVAAVVIAGGMAWPQEESPAEAVVASDAPESATPAPDPAAPAPAPAADAASAGAPDPVAGVLTALSACAENPSAACAVLEDPAAEVPVGVVSDGTGDRTATLLDEYGGVAVYRVDGPGRPSQVLVVVTVNGEGLVRDVYDVADQP
ncbi:hypothetical protein [Microbacterium sp.]|uniref:hypothetical protein n=1 Tax=Microbacterium sp. TaxID=51671 RepID=UPI002898D0AA|nr:hypothetical protein [Microbacterium sp.]